MGRTTRRREPSEVVNTKRSTKKMSRRNNRKNLKRKLHEIDYQNPENWDNFENGEYVVRGYN